MRRREFITPLLRENLGRAVDFPDFTRGKWKSAKPVDIQAG